MAPKPRGLKAGSKKRAAAFDPTAEDAANDATSSTSATATVGGERTMPLDEDWLSVMDLFELMQSAQAALGKVGGSDEGDAESEARNLLRGILHGADVLWKYVDEQEVSGTEANGKPAASADEDKPSPLGEEKKAALGLARPHADSELAFLQGFALHELASLLEPVEHKAVSAVASGSSSSSSSKKRKVDPREPTDPAEWLDRAASKFDYAVRPPTSSGSGAELWSVMTAAYAQRCRADRGLLALARGDSDTANAIVSKSPPKAFAEQLALALPSSDSLDTLETMTAEVGDPLKAVVEALASSISLVEAAEHLDVAERMQLLDRLASDTSDALSQSESLFGEAVAGSRPAQADQWIFEFCSVLADARLAKFVLHEETIEAKFRPEEENDDGDDEVKPLPTSNDQVQAARADGEETILLLRRAIEFVDKLPAADKPAAKLAQYKKLEEALLVYSALFNPDDEEDVQRIEAEIAQVREDGGLEADDGEE